MSISVYKSVWARFLALFSIFTVLAAFGAFFVPSSAQAADTILTSEYLDTDDDGSVDTIRWTFDENVTACAYEAGDWTVDTATDMNISITGLTCTGADAILDIDVTADADETGASTDPVVSYADNGTLGSLTLTSGAAGAHASVTASDAALPLISAVDFGTHTDSGVTFNDIEITYTEDVNVYRFGDGGIALPVGNRVATSGSMGGMTVARDVNNLVNWAAGSGGDMTASSNSGNHITLFASNQLRVEFNSALAAAFFSGTTAPTTPDVSPDPTADEDFVSDLAGNPMNTSQAAVTATNGTPWDDTVPTLDDTYSCDTDLDGDIDRIQVGFSEFMMDSSISGSLFEADNDTTNDGTGEEVPSSFNTATGGCDGTADDTDANDDEGRFDLTNGIEGTESAYLHNVTATARDMAGWRLAVGSELGTEVDRAAPVLMSTNPTDGRKKVNLDQDIVMVFSEAIDSGSFLQGTEYDVTPDPGSLAAIYSNGDRTITLTHDDFALSTSYNVVLDPAEIDADTGAVTLLNAGGPEDGDWTFTSDDGGSGSQGGGAKTYIVVVDEIIGAGLVPGETYTIEWETGGTGQTSHVNILVSYDGGTSFASLSGSEDNDGRYDWVVPDVDTDEAVIRVEGTDTVSVLSTDDTDTLFSILGTPTADDTTGDETTTPTDKGTSPVTGELEDLTPVSPGDIIRGASFDTLYRVTDDLRRRPFINEQVYFTWEDNFDIVKVVTDATLPSLELGGPMLPKAGSVLIKTPSTVHVYAIEDHASDPDRAVKRWIPSEAVATSLLGDDWADYVIDIPDTLYPRFDLGNDMASSDTVDKNTMVKRLGVN